MLRFLIHIFVNMTILLYSYTAFSVTFTVTSGEDDEFAYAWDDIDTEADESSDGVCQDSLGRCTLRAALQELSNIGGGTIIINVDKITINNSLGGISAGSDIEIKAGLEDVTIVISTGTTLEMGDNCKISGITFELSYYVTGIYFGSYCIADNLLFKSNGAVSAIACGDFNKIINCNAESTNTGFLFAIALGGNENEITNFNFKAITGSSNSIIGIDGSNNIIDSINISGFSQTGIVINGDLSKNIIRNSTIVGNPKATQAIGILINGTENTVQNCEVISNVLAGIAIGYMGEIFAVNNVIKNNFIGCTRNYVKAGNGDGITIMSNGNLIENNIIGFNNKNGIYLNSMDKVELGTVSNNIISGNNIGGIKDSEVKMPNEQNGILLLGSVEQNIIGSDNTNDYTPNYIANNVRCGIYSQNMLSNIPERNAYRKNIITNNSNMGIKIDETAQQDIKAPMFDSLVNGIIYGHGGIPGSKIDIYENDLDELGSGEAKKWIKEFPIGEPNYQLQLGELPDNGISATVTNQTNSTSEFSCNIPSIMSFSKQLDVTFFDKISDNADNEYTITFYPGRAISEAKYKINEKAWTPAQITGNTAKFTVNMGSDFKTGKNDLLFASTSCNGFVDTMIFNPYVVVVPEFAAPAGDYSTDRNDPELKYVKGSKIEWPNPNINASYNIPDIVPYIGGAWGIKETGLKFQMTVSSLGTEIPQTVEVNGGFGLGEKQYDLSGEGNVTNSLLKSGLKTDGTITANLPIKLWEKSENLLMVIPTTQTFCELPLGTELCAFLNGLVSAGINASLTLDLGGSADFGAGNTLEWKSGELISSLTLSVIGSANLAGMAGFTVEGSGTGTLTIPFPGLNPSAGGSLNFSAYGQIAGIGSISGNKTWSIGGGIVERKSDNPIVLSNLLPKDDDLKVISANSPFDANASSYVVDGNSQAVVWAEASGNIDSPARNIMLTMIKDGNVTKSVNITTDGKNNRNPKLISDNSGKLIVVWSSNELPDKGINDIDLTAYCNKSKFEYSVLNTNDLTVIKSGSIDVANSFDFSPELVSNENNISLVWIKTDGSTIVGQPGAKASVMMSSFADNNFSTPTELFSDEGIVHLDVTKSKQDAIVIAYEKDFDGNLATVDDREIMLYDQAISSNQLKRLTNNSKPEMMPKICITDDFKINIIYTDLSSIYYAENLNIDNISNIFKGNVSLDFSNAKFFTSGNNKHIIWNAARGFYNLEQDETGAWSKLEKSGEFDYVNILNSVNVLNDGVIEAIFQKFDNSANSVLLEKNELVSKILIFTEFGTGVNELPTSDRKLLIYPNPAYDNMYISNAVGRVEIFNSIGESILTIDNYSNKSIIETEKFLPGIYLIRCGDKTAKFIKL